MSVMLTRPLQIRAALAAELRRAFPQVKTVTEHAGTFGEDEIGKILQRCPALHVAVLGFRPATPVASGGTELTLKCAVFIVTQDSADAPRDTAAINLATGLVQVLDRWQGQEGGLFLAQPARAFAWQNLYDGKSQSKGTMLSALAFDMAVTVGEAFSEGEPITLNELYAGEDQLLPEAAA